MNYELLREKANLMISAMEKADSQTADGYAICLCHLLDTIAMKIINEATSPPPN